MHSIETKEKNTAAGIAYLKKTSAEIARAIVMLSADHTPPNSKNRDLLSDFPKNLSTM